MFLYEALWLVLRLGAGPGWAGRGLVGRGRVGLGARWSSKLNWSGGVVGQMSEAVGPLPGYPGFAFGQNRRERFRSNDKGRTSEKGRELWRCRGNQALGFTSPNTVETSANYSKTQQIVHVGLERIRREIQDGDFYLSSCLHLWWCENVAVRKDDVPSLDSILRD